MESARGVGVDIVDACEVEDALARWGERYLARVYTRREVATWDPSPRRLAVCFAAKEAALKALAPPETEAVPWPSIDVQPGPRGTLLLELFGEGAKLAERRGVGRFVGSATLAGDRAAAVVVALGDTA